MAILKNVFEHCTLIGNVFGLNVLCDTRVMQDLWGLKEPILKGLVESQRFGHHSKVCQTKIIFWNVLLSWNILHPEDVTLLVDKVDSQKKSVQKWHGQDFLCLLKIIAKIDKRAES